jgi:hypothetical protein
MLDRNLLATAFADDLKRVLLHLETHKLVVLFGMECRNKQTLYVKGQRKGRAGRIMLL